MIYYLKTILLLAGFFFLFKARKESFETDHKKGYIFLGFAIISMSFLTFLELYF